MMTETLLAYFAKVTLVLVFAWACSLALRRASAAVRHQVWASAIVSVLMLPLFSGLLPQWRVAVVTKTETVEAPMVVESAQPQSMPEAAVSRDVPVSRSFRVTPMGAAWAAWLAGSLILFARLGWGLVQLRRIRRESTFVERLPEGVNLLESASPASMPVAWGWRKPCVLLPRGFREWDSDRLHAVLAHELAHIGRRDWLTQIAAEVAKCVYWFHPLVWLAAAQLREESERAADDAVLRAGIDGASYANHLLQLARAYQHQLRVATIAQAVAGSSPIERRLSAVLERGVRRGALSRRAAGVSFAACIAALAPFAVFLPAQETRRVVVAQAAPAKPVAQATQVQPASPKTPVVPAAPKQVPVEVTPPLAFEVASIRPNPGPWRVMRGYKAEGPLLTLEAYNVVWLMAEAYGLEDYQLVVGPGLSPDAVAGDKFFNISAKAAGDATPTRAQFREMLKEMLASRFGLKVHWESREMQVYALTRGKGELKLRESKPETAWSAYNGVNGRNQFMKLTAYSMPEFVRNLRTYVDRPVVDKTGLTGKYDIDIEATPIFRLNNNTQPTDIDMRDAIQDVLGLRLETTKEPMPVLVLDVAEKPTEN